jgi:hypothetical protein
MSGEANAWRKIWERSARVRSAKRPENKRSGEADAWPLGLLASWRKIWERPAREWPANGPRVARERMSGEANAWRKIWERPARERPANECPAKPTLGLLA